MGEKLNCNIVLIGFMGTGKTTIAKLLSRVFDLKVIEMDGLIVERQGMSISEIFEKHGEEYFRDLETNLLKELQKDNNLVISCGGGTPLREVNVKEMKKIGKVVLLNASAETIFARVKDNHDRPLLENNMNVEFIEGMLSKRRDKYLAAADIIIDTDGKSKDEIAMEVANSVR